jgi:hypothetical protein
MNDDVQGLERIQGRQPELGRQDRILKLARPTALLIAASFLLMGQASRMNIAEAQYITFNDNVPPNSGCYKPELYDHGVNMMVKVWSNSLTAEDLRSSGIQPMEGFLDGLSQVQAGKLAQVVAKDLSRLKDTGIVVDNQLPRDASGKYPIHFYVQINLESIKRTSGEVTGYVAAVHLEEVCSTWGEGKNIGSGVRTVEVPGILILSTLNDMVRNVEDLVYDNVMDVVKARRQAIADANSQNKQAVPEKRP